VDKVRLNNYIVTSFISHLIMLAMLTLVSTGVRKGLEQNTIDVDIVGPLERQVQRELLESTPPMSRRIRRVPPPKRVIEDKRPETLYGEGMEERLGQKEGDIKESAGDSTLSSAKGTKEILPETGKGTLPHSFLFDRETIEKYASKGLQKKDMAKRGLTFDAPELMHRGYMKMLKQKIERIWKYPEEAARRGISGDLYIRFSIRRDGSLGEARLIRTSGYRDLDDAALKALSEAEPFWPLPDDWEQEELTITGHFIYFLGESFLL
jgi:protein TonB